MTEDELTSEVLAYIRERDHVSFAELSRNWPDYFTGGDRGIVLNQLDNIVVWEGMTEMACDVYRRVLKEPDIEIAPASLMVYLCDGSGLNLPLAKRPVKYKKPHWLPCVFRLKGKQHKRRADA
jgi:hypothetical protein